jgi:hypothetical protein
LHKPNTYNNVSISNTKVSRKEVDLDNIKTQEAVYQYIHTWCTERHLCCLRYYECEQNNYQHVCVMVISLLKTVNRCWIISSLFFSGIRVARSLVFCVVIWWSLFVHLSFYFWALCFRSLDLRILITPLFSSNYAICDTDILYCLTQSGRP